MTNDGEAWLAVAADLGVRVIAPYTVDLGEHCVTFAAFFPQFGGPSGMVTDPKWSVIAPHKAKLVAARFGYSCVDLGGSDQESMREMLADWGWSGASDDKPDWV